MTALLAIATGFAACTSPLEQAAPDNALTRVDSGAPVEPAPPGWSRPEPGAFEIRVPFEATWDPSSGRLDFDFDSFATDLPANPDYRTQSMPLWCAGRVAVENDGVEGAGRPNTAELVTGFIGTYAECDTVPLPDGVPSLADLAETDGALCADVTFRSFYPIPIEQLYAFIFEVAPLDNAAYTWADRVLRGLGTGAQPPAGFGAPSDNLGGLFFYGDIEPDDPAARANGSFDNDVTVRWTFRYPIEGAPFSFRGQLVARYREVCNGLDDNCDGRIDNGAGCFGAGMACVDDTDCGVDGNGDALLCVDAGGGQRSCGGGLLQEDCSGTVDTNGNGLVGCQDPTCNGVPPCADFSCASGNVGSELSMVDGDYLRTGVTEPDSANRFSLPEGQTACGSRLFGADHAWLWTAPVAGDYIFSTEGSTYDTALVVVRGGCPVDLAASAGTSDLFCADDNVNSIAGELLTLNLSAGETVTVVIDSAVPPSSAIGRGGWSLSIFKTPSCGDGIWTVTDRFGNPAEACDTGGFSSTCNADCTLDACGDGTRNPVTEACDDGNTAAGDGCSPLCAVETGFDCSGAACQAICGDGLVLATAGEVCDDGNASGGDGCSADCRAVEAGWTCLVAGALCEPVCGDGVTVGPEVCDSPVAGDPGCLSCLQVAGGFRCPPGGGACTDIDECADALAAGVGLCSVNGVCVNTPGAYRCECTPGFSGDGLQCDDVNECDEDLDDCAAAAACLNLEGGFTCACDPGYRDDSAVGSPGRVCTDIDECAQGLCDPLVTCTNLPGTFTCGACPSGYSGAGDTSCQPLSCADPGAPAFATQVGTYTSFVLGTVVEFACINGYVTQGGSATRTCGASGGGVEFDGSPLVCVPRSCGTSAPSVSNATVSNAQPDWVFQDTASYTCDAGYRGQGGVSPQAVCGADGLFTVSGSCVPFDCGGLSAPSNGTVDVSGGTLFQSVATYACNPGWSLVGSSTRTCEDGGWGGVAPSCQQVTCAPPSPPANAELTGGPYAFVAGETLFYTCQEGFVPQGGAPQQTCGNDGTYGAVTGSCVPVTCPMLTAPVGGTMTGLGDTFLSERSFACNAGLTPAGSNLRVCQSNGTWSGDAFTCTDCNLTPGLPQCAALSCGAAPGPSDGLSSAPSVSSLSPGGVATYACNPGATVTGSAGGATSYQRTCVSGGTTASWSSPSGACQVINCGSLSASAPLSVSTAGGTLFGATANYSCALGTRLQGSATRTCGTSGWSGSPPTCQALVCPAPTPVSGGSATPSTGGNAIGSTAAHSCRSGDGFIQSGGTTSQSCVDDGNPVSTSGAWSWSGAALQCTLRECPSFDIANAAETLLTSVGPNGRSVGAVVQFACADGYVVQGTTEGTTTRTCGTGGGWTGGLPTCVRRPCDPLPSAPGTVSGGPVFSFPLGESTQVSGTVATYNCASGARLGGSPTGGTSAAATCGNQGNWTAWTGTCAPVTCQTPPTAPAGSNSTLSAGWSSSAGGTATYTCTPGFSINGLPAANKFWTATCVDGEGWVLPEDTTCEVFECPLLPATVTATNDPTVAATVAYRTGGGAPTTLRLFGHQAVYARNTGYRLTSASDSTVRTCQANGTWSGVIPTFERMECASLSASGLTVTYLLPAPSSTTSTRLWVGHRASFSCVGGFAPSTATQVCTETNETNVTWFVGGSAAPSPTCQNVDECATGNPCGEDTDDDAVTPGVQSRFTCTDTVGSFTCGCNAATGWAGTAVTGAPATCDGICGDGLVRGTEVCDDGAWNDRPWTGLTSPAPPHPRYPGGDCEGVECDCIGPNASATPGCANPVNPLGSTSPRAVCSQNGVAGQLAAGNCRSFQGFTHGRCADGLDNDGDGRTDCQDPGCSGKATCPEWNQPGCRMHEYLGPWEGTIVRNLTTNPALNADSHWVQGGVLDRVFLWQAPYPGTFVIETCTGTGGVYQFDTLLGVYRSRTCGAGFNPDVAFNDDIDGNKFVRGGCSAVAVTAAQGEPLTIVVSAPSGQGGNFPLTIYAQPNRSCGNGVLDAPIGMGISANLNRVPDVALSASSSWDPNHGPQRGRLNMGPGGGAQAWAAGLVGGVIDPNAWIEVDFQAPVTIGAVGTQGRGDWDQWVTEFEVQYWNGSAWVLVNNAQAALYKPAQPTLFPGNWDRNTVRYNWFTPVTARRWRVLVKQYTGHPSMRFEFFTFVDQCDDGNNTSGDGCSAFCWVEPGSSCVGGGPTSPSACYAGLSLACGDGVVQTNRPGYVAARPNASFTASSFWCNNDDSNWAPWQGRINNTTTAWHSGCSQQANQWWGVDLGSSQPVGAVVTRGRPSDFDQWVTRYQVGYSFDGVNYTLVENGRIFWGNTDRNTPVTNNFNTITARWWRIYVVEFVGNPTMRADFLRPLPSWTEARPDSAFTASGWWENNEAGSIWAPWRARFSNTSSAWHPRSGDPGTNGWWEVDLGERRAVGSIGTRGRPNIDQWVTQYQVAYRNTTSEAWTFIEGGRVFQGNTDRDTAVYNGWQPVLARYWRVYPIAWYWSPVMRIELFPMVEQCDDGNLNNGDGCSNLCLTETNWRCYGQPSLCGSRRTLTWSGLALNFGYSWSSTDALTSVQGLSACNTVTGLTVNFNLNPAHTAPAQLITWVNNSSVVNPQRGDTWWPIMQNVFLSGWIALPGASVHTTMFNGRTGNANWRWQMSDYTLDADGGRLTGGTLDIFCR